MFKIPRPFGYSRRQFPDRFEVYRSRSEWTDGETIWGLAWREQMKLAPERRPHPAYHYWRNVHPCYYYRKWERGSVRILKEAWIVKIERNSPRAMKPLNELVIANAKPEDAEDIVKVHFAAVHETGSAAYPEEVLNDWSPLVIDERVERMRRAITERQEVCLVARWNGEVIGFGSVVTEQNELRSLYVLPKVGRQGIGSKLLYALEALALAEGGAFLEMDASLNAKLFYAAHGYQIVSQSVHRLRSGREMACIKMKKLLTDNLVP